MILIDSHTHTRYSFDSTVLPEVMIFTAIEKGIKNLCFTEHLDIDKSNKHEDFKKKFTDYFDEMYKLQEKYKSKIDIIIGLEAGYSTYHKIVESIVNFFPFEYIINSIHTSGELDFCSSARYITKDKVSVYDDYLKTVLESLSVPYRFDTIGHLGYPSRFAPFSDNAFCYHYHKKLFDKIFEEIIKKEIILEVNTSVYNSVHASLASGEMLKNYYSLGGRLVTFSSDSHRPDTLGYKYNDIILLLKQIGFTHLTKSKNGKKEYLAI